MTQEFDWDTRGMSILIGLVDVMRGCGTRCREMNADSGVSVVFSYGGFEDWCIGRITGTSQEMTHLIRLVSLYIQHSNDSMDGVRLSVSSVFRSICTRLAIQMEGNMLTRLQLLELPTPREWEELRDPLMRMLRGEVQFPH